MFSFPTLFEIKWIGMVKADRCFELFSDVSKWLFIWWIIKYHPLIGDIQRYLTVLRNATAYLSILSWWLGWFELILIAMNSFRLLIFLQLLLYLMCRLMSNTWGYSNWDYKPQNHFKDLYCNDEKYCSEDIESSSAHTNFKRFNSSCFHFKPFSSSLPLKSN